MAVLEVRNSMKNFGDTKVLKDISFSLEKGQALAIIGSSGSGKTTLLRCLNFLEKPTSGTIIVNDEVLFDGSSNMKIKDKDLRLKRLHFGLVFQNFNLFPQYTALDNVTLAERLLAKEREDYKSNKKEINEQIKQHGLELLDMMGLAEWIITLISFQADNSRELLLQGHWPLIRIFCVLTNPHQHLTRNLRARCSRSSEILPTRRRQ